MHVEDGQGHRQTFAPVDDPDQIGVLQVVIGIDIAHITVPDGQDLPQSGGPCRRIGGRVGHRGHGAGELVKMPAIGCQVDRRPIRGRQGQRHVGDVHGVVRHGRGLFQGGPDVTAQEGLRWV